MTRWDGDHMVPVELFRDQLRTIWSTYTLGEIAAATGVSVTTIHGIMWGPRDHVQIRTAARLKVGLASLETP